MIVINVPDAPWSEVRTTLSGIPYLIIFRFSTTDERWRMDLYKYDGTPILTGNKILEGSPSLLGGHILDDFPDGDIYLLRQQNDGLPCGRHNLGIGKPYELVYAEHRELAE